MTDIHDQVTQELLDVIKSGGEASGDSLIDQFLEDCLIWPNRYGRKLRWSEVYARFTAWVHSDDAMTLRQFKSAICKRWPDDCKSATYCYVCTESLIRPSMASVYKARNIILDDDGNEID